MRPSPFYHRSDPSRRFFAFDMFGTLVVKTEGTVRPIFEALCGYYPGIEPRDVFHAYREQDTAFRRTNSGLELPIDAVIGNLDAMFGFENDPGAMEGPLLRDTRLYGPASGSAAALGYLKDMGYRIGSLGDLPGLFGGGERSPGKRFSRAGPGGFHGGQPDRVTVYSL